MVRHLLSILAAVALMSSTLGARADEVVMAIPPYQPPYVLLESSDIEHAREGIMIDILRESLAFKGHTLAPRVAPYNRFAPELESGRVAGVGYMKGELPPLYSSEESIHFINFAITHPDDDREITALSDLEGSKLVTWQGARADLGDEFSNVVPSLALYKEMADQDRQTRVFIRRRADVIVLDGYIFRFFARHYGADPDTFKYNDIVGGRLGFSAGFVSETIRDDFDEGLAELKRSGRYEEIYNFYSNEYSLDRGR